VLTLVLFNGGEVFAKALTCEECREFDRERSRIQLELTKKEHDMERAFKKKEFRKVSELRNEINELRRQHLTLKGKEPECKIACRPDVVKEAECNKIIAELAEMDKESVTSEDETKRIDERYKDLSVCNRELKKFRELQR
jgi:hypothetical protein